MKIMIITADGYEHRYVTNNLAQELGNVLKAVIVEQPSQRKFSLKKFSKIKKRYGYLRIFERIVTKMVRKIIKERQRQDEALIKVLGKLSLGFHLDCPIVTVSSANTTRSIELIEKIKPDYLLIYGTSIINNRVLSIPAKTSLNLHTGISPYYRGSSTVFWALFNREPEMVGSTVHECTSDIDGGNIYGRISVKLDENDDHYFAFAKCVKKGADLYANVSKRLVTGENIQVQRQDFSLGKEYRFKDLTFAHEIIMKYRIKKGVIKKMLVKHIDKPPLFP